MSEPIRNAEARRFWEAVYLHQMGYDSNVVDENGSSDCSHVADSALYAWSERFADAETLRDIAENRARREAS